METTSHRIRTIVLGIAVCAGSFLVGPLAALAQINMTQLSQKSQDASIGGSIKRGIGKVGQALTPDSPPKPPANDPVSLNTKANPGPELHVAMAHLYLESGRMDHAAEHYQKALKMEPTYLGGLLGYARLKDRIGRTDEAIKLYQQAIKAHPNTASAYNNFGLFYAKNRKLDEAVKILGQAVRLAPRNVRYRNNLATILAELGRNNEAFDQLQAVHGEAIAYYNLGYLLERKGDVRSAAQHYAMALKVDTTLVSARMGIQRLAARPSQGRSAPSATRQVRTMAPTTPVGNPAPQPWQPDRLGTRPMRSGPPAVSHMMPAEPAAPKRITPPPAPTPSETPSVRQLPPQPKRETPMGAAPSVRVHGTRDNGVAPLPPGEFVPKRLPPINSARATGAAPMTGIPSPDPSEPVAPLPPPTGGPALQFSP